MKKLILFIALVASSATGCHFCKVADAQILPINRQETANSPDDVAARNRLQMLQQLVEQKDLHKLEDAAALIQKEKSQSNEKQYFPLMLTVVRGFYTTDYGLENRGRKYELAKKYARLALQRAKEMSPSVRLQFLSPLFIITAIGEEKDDKQFEIDEEDIYLFADLWVFLDKRIDKTYDPRAPQNLGYMSIAPQPKKPLPLSQITFSGMRPEDVKDPETRASYEAALKENARKVKKNLEYFNLKEVDAEFTLEAERTIFRLCSQSRISVDDVSEIVTDAGVSPERKQHLLNYIAIESEKAAKAKELLEKEQSDALAARK